MAYKQIGNNIHSSSSEDVVKCIMQKGELKKVVYCSEKKEDKKRKKKQRSRRHKTPQRRKFSI